MDFLPLLPFEVALRVFGELRLADLLACERVCRAWRGALRQEAAGWRLKCALLGARPAADGSWQAAFLRWVGGRGRTRSRTSFPT